MLELNKYTDSVPFETGKFVGAYVESSPPIDFVLQYPEYRLKYLAHDDSKTSVRLRQPLAVMLPSPGRIELATRPNRVYRYSGVLAVQCFIVIMSLTCTVRYDSGAGIEDVMDALSTFLVRLIDTSLTMR